MSEPSPAPRNISAYVGAGLTIVTAFLPSLLPGLPRAIYAFPVLCGTVLLVFGLWSSAKAFLLRNRNALPIFIGVIGLMVAWPLVIFNIVWPALSWLATDTASHHQAKVNIVSMAQSSSQPAIPQPTLPSATLLSPSTQAQPIQQPARVYTDKDVAYFINIMNNLNPISANDILSNFNEKRVRFYAKLVSTSMFGREVSMVFSVKGAFLSCIINPMYRSWAAGLVVGTNVHFDGKIRLISDHNIHLGDCEPDLDVNP